MDKTPRKNTSIALSGALNAFISQQVDSGRYGSASEVVRAGLRLLEAQETQMTALRSALEAGESSPISASFSLERVKNAIDQG